MTDVELIESISINNINHHEEEQDTEEDQQTRLLNESNSCPSYVDAIQHDYNQQHQQQDLNSINTNLNGYQCSLSLNSTSSTRSIISRLRKYRLFSRTRNNNTSQLNQQNSLTHQVSASETEAIREVTNTNVGDMHESISTLTDMNPKETVIIRGDGNLTIFGVLNSFNDEFPQKLSSKIAPEEYKETLNKINKILNKEFKNSLRWLVFGSLCCCCTLGCSLLPVIFINKKAKLKIKKYLIFENDRLYNKLGIKWRLSKQKYGQSTLYEYIICIDILPILPLYQPD